MKAKDNPFIPRTIKILLEQLNSDIRTNIRLHLKQGVEEAINKSFKRGGRVIPNISGVYNEFNHRRLSHYDITNKIRLEIREYLKIDSMP